MKKNIIVITFSVIILGFVCFQVSKRLRWIKYYGEAEVLFSEIQDVATELRAINSKNEVLPKKLGYLESASIKNIIKTNYTYSPESNPILKIVVNPYFTIGINDSLHAEWLQTP